MALNLNASFCVFGGIDDDGNRIVVMNLPGDLGSLSVTPLTALLMAEELCKWAQIAMRPEAPPVTKKPV